VTRLHIRPDAIAGNRVIFDRQETHHLAHVLRVRAGTVIRAVDGTGHEVTVRLTRIHHNAAEGEVIGWNVLASESPIELTLVQGVPKGDKLELIIRMTTELGVARIVPLIGERTIPRREPGRHSERVTRWRRVAQEAAKQSGRAVIPEVQAPVRLAEWLVEPRAPGLLLCFWERAEAPLARVLPEGPMTRATLIVGPEGGLSAGEVQSLQSAGAVIASLGPRILRTETAAVVGLALLQSRYGDLGVVTGPS
jgi:16S rRNA (uracil1498-N3)-methyltransferase